MQQVTFIMDDKQSLDSVFIQLEKNKSYLDATSKLLQIYTTNIPDDEIEDLLFKLKKKDPDLKIVGSTAFETIGSGKRCYDSTVLSFSFFSESEVEVLEYDVNDKTIELVESEVNKRVNTAENIAGILVFVSVVSDGLSRIIDSISSEDYPVFGARAGGNLTYMPKVFANKVYNSGIVIVILKGSNLHIKADYCLGWKPIGKEMEITKTKGNYCVEEIDGLPAVQIYKKYLNVEPDENFTPNILEFPFIFNRNGQEISRSPYTYDESGRLYFNADIIKGERVKLSYGNRIHVLNDSYELSQNLTDFQPEAIIMIACINRLSLLKEDMSQEIEYFRQITNNTNGLFAFSEIVSKGLSCGIMHSSLVAVALREGRAIKENAHGYTNKVSGSKESGSIPFAERMLFFLEATTADLEETNLKLKEMATTDQLTDINNRRKLEEIFNYECRKREDDNHPISIIVFDIDYFKKVNDVYGHETGDNVLKDIGRLLKKYTRKGDSVGRWGGEEFLAVLPNTNLKEAIDIANRVRQGVSSYNFKEAGQITISGGVAQHNQGESMADVFIRADQNLYKAKENGRNRIN